MTLKYRELQCALKALRTNGTALTCKLDADYSTLQAEHERLTLSENDTSVDGVTCMDVITDDILNDTQVCHSRNTDITVLEARNDDTLVLGIRGEYRTVPCYWDDDLNTAITVNKEVSVVGSSPFGRTEDICKIEVIGDSDGSYRAFPLSSVEGACDWLYPDIHTRYYQIKARLSVLDTHSCNIRVSAYGQRLDLISSEDICICKYYEEEALGITKYFPSIGTFQRVGGRWLLADRAHNVKWISVVQGAKQHQFKVGTKVYLQDDIGKPGIDLYCIDRLYYAHLCLMAICMNQRTKLASIVPMVQLHLPQNLQK